MLPTVLGSAGRWDHGGCREKQGPLGRVGKPAGLGQEAARGRGPRQGGARGPRRPREARVARGPHAGLTGFRVGVSQLSASLAAGLTCLLLRLLSDRQPACPWPCALFLTAPTRMTACFQLHHLSNTEVLMVANQSPAGPADSSPWLLSSHMPEAEIHLGRGIRGRVKCSEPRGLKSGFSSSGSDLLTRADHPVLTAARQLPALPA